MDDHLLDPQLAADLQAAGLPFPTDADAVERFDRVFGPHPPLPPHLADGGALFDRLVQRPAAIIHPLPLRSPLQSEVDESYALAARNGGDLSDETRRLMRQAREQHDADDPATPDDNSPSPAP